MFVRQASPFFPLMLIASEPHIPSRQDRRYAIDWSTDLCRTGVATSISFTEKKLSRSDQPASGQILLTAT
jgi:hypothetical protein